LRYYSNVTKICGGGLERKTMYIQYIGVEAASTLRSNEKENAGEELRETRRASSSEKVGQFYPSARIIVR